MDTDMNLSMTFDVSFAKAETDKYWSARSHALGLVAYGATKRDSEARISSAVDSMVSVLLNSGGVEILRKWLDAHHIEHSITTPGPREHKTIRRELAIHA